MSSGWRSWRLEGPAVGLVDTFLTSHINFPDLVAQVAQVSSI